MSFQASEDRFPARKESVQELVARPESWQRPHPDEVWRNNPTNFRGLLLRRLAVRPDVFRRFEAVQEALDREGLPHDTRGLARDLLRHVAFRQPGRLKQALERPSFLEAAQLPAASVELAHQLLSRSQGVGDLSARLRGLALSLLAGETSADACLTLLADLDRLRDLLSELEEHIRSL